MIIDLNNIVSYNESMPRHINFAKYIVILLVALLFVAIFCVENEQIANALDDNFDILFPSSSYFQSSSPTLISANNDFLIVYDNQSSALYSRSNTTNATYTYHLDCNDVVNIFAIGNNAFVYADDKYYLIDLTSATSQPREVTLNTPQDISYFNSDGNYLYAKSTAGYLSVYDKDLNIAYNADNIYNDDLFAGKPVVTGKENMAYVFTIAYGNPFFIKYDIQTNTQSIGIPLTKYVQEAYVGDVIFALETVASSENADEKNIVGIDKETGDVLFATSLHPAKFFAYKSNLFTIEGNTVNIYTLTSDNKSIEKMASISMSGSDLEHFDNPKDVVKCGDCLYVADSENNRLCKIQNGIMSKVSLPFAPQRLCVEDGICFVVCDNALCIVDGNNTTTYPCENILDVAFLDKLYILTNDGVYTIIANNFIKLASIEGARRIAVAEDGNNIYLLKDDEIARMNKMGQFLPAILSGDFVSVKDFAIDYKGQLFLAYKDRVKQYYKGDLIGELVLTNSSVKATINSVNLDNTALYFTTDECFVGKCNVDATTRYEQPTYSIDLDIDNYTFATISNGDRLIYDLDLRDESASFATNDVVIAYNDSQEYTIVIHDGKLYKVANSCIERHNITSLSADFVTNTHTTLYRIPGFYDGKIEVEEGTRLTLIGKDFGYDNNIWSLVKYNNTTYFVKSKDIEEYHEVIVVPEIEKVYGKAKADRVGGLCNVYSNEDISSSVLTQIADGTKVEILGESDEYYEVLINGLVGYMLKSEVVIDALTTVQIIAIALCVIVSLAGMGVFVAIYLTRKHDEEKKEKNNLE